MPATLHTGSATLDITALRSRFPVLQREVNGYPLTYLDNAATTQKPQQVIDALTHYYSHYNANIHRGVHTLAQEATEAFEATRQAVQELINAPEKEEIIFTKGTSESINLVAATFGRAFVGKGQNIIISGMEHHSNIVPWQMLCQETGAELRVLPVLDNGELDLADYERLLDENTALVAICMASNTLGTVNPVKEMTAAAHKLGARVLLDAAQALPHSQVDVQALDCDFLAASAHKMYGPTGVGILYGKREVLEAMPPYQGGGEMISEVTFARTTYNDIPFKFEAGTPNIADVIAFREAIAFVKELGLENIARHEAGLLAQATSGLQAIEGVSLVGTATHKVGVLSFNIDGLHPFDTGMMLDALGIAVRTGHHCTMPLVARYGIEGTVRASFAVYNTSEEVERLILAVSRIAQRKRK
ncbi:MAG TPA: cysteine desulfurase [Flammeovirgaceae bacterium]|nr:cysteine desulfurase [Flammeovirgaceae bacterium]